MSGLVQHQENVAYLGYYRSNKCLIKLFIRQTYLGWEICKHKHSISILYKRVRPLGASSTYVIFLTF